MLKAISIGLGDTLKINDKHTGEELIKISMPGQSGLVSCISVDLEVKEGEEVNAVVFRLSKEAMSGNLKGQPYAFEVILSDLVSLKGS